MTFAGCCRKCLSFRAIICHPHGEPGICPECCDHPGYSYARGEGYTCDACGEEPPPDYFAGWDSE